MVRMSPQDIVTCVLMSTFSSLQRRVLAFQLHSFLSLPLLPSELRPDVSASASRRKAPKSPRHTYLLMQHQINDKVID